jgi:hypothetical protein
MRTRPLTLAAIGVVLFSLDFRVVAIDILPDFVGWALVAFAAFRLSMAWSGRLAVVATVASLAEVFLPYHYVSLDPLTLEVVPNPAPGTDYPERLVFDAVHGPRLVLLIVMASVGGMALWLLLRELTRRAASSRDERASRRLRRLSWAVAVVWALPYVARAVGQGALDDGFDPVWNGGWETPAIAGIATMVAVAITFGTWSNRRWSATGDDLGSPWAELMVRDQQG